MSEPTRIRVATPSPYDVLIGRGVLDRLPALLRADVRRAAVISSERQPAAAAAVRNSLVAAGFEVCAIAAPDGEGAKSAEVAASCWAALGRAGFTRSDAVVSVGGGAITDLAGFVAATFLRGLAVVHVPTTVLAMVDAAVGGKTGINTEEGKNLVGAFHEPAGVLCDLESLASLPHDEVVNGLAEVVKCGLIADPAILDLLESDPRAAVDPSSNSLRALIEHSVAVKAEVVARDLRERTSDGSDVGREALNYGHTLGHAIERAERYDFMHGHAVAIGMVFAATVSRLHGRLADSVVERHWAALSAVGLPTSYTGADWETLSAAMRLDKKTRGSTLRLVVLDDLARPAILAEPDPELLRTAYREIAR
jgi:3-dehydroquinate synthase